MKILGSDYDGTLNHNGIDGEKIAALKRWREEGNVFALISGRFSRNLLDVYNSQQFPCDYLIANNGAVLMKTDGTVISDIRCDGALADPLLTLLFELGCPYGTVQTDKYYMIRAAEFEEDKGPFSPKNMPTIPYFNQISTVLPDCERAEKVTECIRERFSGLLNPLQNGDCIDIVRADVDKAKGLYILMEHLGAKYEDIIAVGDNINDKDMIREFRSYAMESGVDMIKKLADHVTPSVTELIKRELSL